MADNPMMGVAVAAMRWHHARLRRIEIERRYKDFMQGASYRHGCWRFSDEQNEARRLEARYKRRLTKSCEMASDKPKHTEVIDI